MSWDNLTRSPPAIITARRGGLAFGHALRRPQHLIPGREREADAVSYVPRLWCPVLVDACLWSARQTPDARERILWEATSACAGHHRSS
jgi:hypothetical protein